MENACRRDGVARGEAEKERQRARGGKGRVRSIGKGDPVRTNRGGIIIQIDTFPAPGAAPIVTSR